MNWILIANTTVSKIDYNMLVLALVGIIFFVLGFRFYRQARGTREESESQ